MAERWTTEDEIAYLANLGRHFANGQSGDGKEADITQRSVLLETARNHVPHRRWDRWVDPTVLVDFIVMELARIEATGLPYEGSYAEVQQRYLGSNVVEDDPL